DRVLRELALGAGAREVIVYSGSTINTKAENYDAVKTRSRAT
ncbi:MAG: rod shape-determining protein MreB, partial [Gammaproteobacteria bacterium]|nr:rod shape-determining protein MreB [Gammaproteobacteria bacterium]